MNLNPESSSVTRSTSEANSGYSIYGISGGNSNGIESFFPLFDAVSQKVRLPRFVYLLAGLYLFLQVLVNYSCFLCFFFAIFFHC